MNSLFLAISLVAALAGLGMGWVIHKAEASWPYPISAAFVLLYLVVTLYAWHAFPLHEAVWFVLLAPLHLFFTGCGDAVCDRFEEGFIYYVKDAFSSTFSEVRIWIKG